MVKRQETIRERMEIMRASVQEPPIGLLKDARKFINQSLEKYIFQSLEGDRNKDDILKRLELVENSAKKIARALIPYKSRKKGEAVLPSGNICHDEILFHNRVELEYLKHQAEEIIATLERASLPLSVESTVAKSTKLYRTASGTAGQKTAEQSLAYRLKNVIKAIDKHVNATAVTLPSKGKRGDDVYRKDLIHALTDVWCEITDLAPEPYRQNYDRKPPDKTGPSRKNTRTEVSEFKQSEFCVFLMKGLTLSGRHYNLEEAAKEARSHYKATLEHYKKMGGLYLTKSKEEDLTPNMREYYKDRSQHFRTLSKGK